MLLDSTLDDSKSEKEVRKDSTEISPLTPARHKAFLASRFSVDYWRDRLFRPTYNSGAERQEVQEWYVQVQHAKRREKVGLSTNNKDEAARRASKLYQRLRATDWETALKEFCPRIEAMRAMSSLSVGAYISHVTPLLRVRPRTMEIYFYALRKIARESTNAVDTSKGRFNPQSHEWRRVSDEISLDKLSPKLVNEWKDRVMAAAGAGRKERDRAGRNVNSFLRNARALFSRSILERLKEKGVKLPKTLPFEGVKLEAAQNMNPLWTLSNSSRTLGQTFDKTTPTSGRLYFWPWVLDCAELRLTGCAGNKSTSRSRFSRFAARAHLKPKPRTPRGKSMWIKG
jgi:hypothetical protein